MRSRLLPLMLAWWVSACSYAVVESGHGAVLTQSDGTVSALTEGAVSIGPYDQVDDFNLRSQSRSTVLHALTADGVPVLASDSLVSYHLDASHLVAIDRKLGSNYQTTIVDPIVQSTVNRILGHYRWDQLDPEHITEAEKQISAIAAERLKPHHIILDTVDLKGVFPELPGYAQAVSDTAIWEQRVIESQTQLQLARQHAEGLQTQANGLVASFRAVAPTLTPEVLEHNKLKAWRSLLLSPNTTIQVVPNNNVSIVEALP